MYLLRSFSCELIVPKKEDGDQRRRFQNLYSPNTQRGKSLFILIAFRLWVSWGTPWRVGRGAIPQEISAREVLVGLEGFCCWPVELSLCSASVGLPSPHAPPLQPLCCGSAHFCTAGHSSLLCPAVALAPWHRWGRAIHSCWLLGCCPHSPQSSQGLQNTYGDFDTWGPESELRLRRALSPLLLGKSHGSLRCASLVARLLAESLRAGGREASRSGQDSP